MNCPKCSQSVPDGARFCGKCGQPIDVGVRPPPEPAAAGAGGGVSGVGAGVSGGVGVGGAIPFPGAAAHPLPGLLDRVKNILLTPKTEWPVIASEPTSIAQLFTGYVAPMAGFAAVMSFIRMSVIGVSIPFGGTIRMPMTSGLTSAVLTFVFGMIGMFLVGFIINTLAPTFSGERDQRQSLKTAAYGFTPAWLATALTFLPLGTLLQFLAGIYGIYLLYLGLPVMMRSKPDKAVGYTASVVVCTFLVGILFAVVSAALGGAGRMAGFGGNAAVYSQTPEGKAAAAEQGGAILGNMLGGALGTDDKGKAGLGSALANLAKAGQKMEQDQANAASGTAGAAGNAGAAGGSANAGAATQSASSAGSAGAAGSANAGASSNSSGSAGSASDPQNAMAAAGGLLAALGGALGGSHRVEPVDFNTLKGMLPASLPQMQRTGAEGSSQTAVGVKSSSATARYQGTGGGAVVPHVEIKISDISGVSGLMDAASGLVPTGDKESDTGFEKDTVLNGRAVHEKFDRASTDGEVDVIVAKRFDVDVTGRGLDMAQLEQALGTVDLARLEAMKDVGAIKN